MTNFRNMDPVMLLSLVNMKLRNDYPDLDTLARGLELDKAWLIERLAEAGFEYIEAQRQFR